jgi:hypothetical protein
MAQTVHVARADQLADALATLGLDGARAVLVIVGGAQTLAGDQLDTVERLFETVVAPFCDEQHVTVVDGGTDSGVMAAMGRARASADRAFPLVGVVAAGTVVGGDPSDARTDADGRARFERHHTHFVVVPGTEWGDESPWIIDVARRLAAGAPVAALLAGGGDVSSRDVENLGAAGYPVLVLAGTGGLADRLRGDDQQSVTVLDGAALPADLDAALRRALG